MAGLSTELADALEAFADCCDTLLLLAEEKKDAVIHNNTDILRRVSSSENEAVGKAQRLEKRRAALFEDIAVVLNKPKDGLTLDGLCAIIQGQPEHSRLKAVSERLSAALPALKAANENNRALIQNALEYIDFNINLLRTTFVDESMDYSDHGKRVDIRN